MENNKDRSKPMMIIIIALLVVMLVGIAVLAVFMMNRLNKMEGAEENGRESSSGVLSPADIKQFSLGDPITTNLLKTDDVDHMIVVSLTIGIDYTNTKKGDELLAVLAESEEIARDIAIGVIRNASYDLLTKADGYDILKQNILEKIQDEFQSNLIVAVYMYDIRYV